MLLGAVKASAPAITSGTGNNFAVVNNVDGGIDKCLGWDQPEAAIVSGYTVQPGRLFQGDAMADPQGLKPNSDPKIGFPRPNGEVEKYFKLHRHTPPGTFEIGLVLGGTVSAGCYTAGVLDFLIEALDAWTMAKEAGDPLAPRHNVKIKAVSGTSGGGINAILLARALGYAAEPYDPGAATITNLLRAVWVDKIDISSLLQTTDLAKGAPVQSLLCADVLGEVGKLAGTFVGPPLGTHDTPAKRSYVDDHLPVVLTVTNLRGVQYASSFNSGTGRKEFYADHADRLAFRVNVTGIPDSDRPDDVKRDETWIDYHTNSAPYGVFRYPWEPLVEAARATSAFPVGLPPIVIHRNVEQYRYRFTVVAEGDCTRRAEWMPPQWTYLIAEGFTRDDPYRALCVDGGVFNNEPISFAHNLLAGALGSNPREGDKACRAILLVDPFSDAGDIGPDRDIGMLRTAGTLIGAMKNGARFQTSDFSLFTDENVYSRFLVTPVRKVKKDGSEEVFTGGSAIVSSSFFAFMGFMCRDYRNHDFELGRRNCQQFLRAHFVLPAGNSLFEGWDDKQREKFGRTDEAGRTFYPIVPLMGKAYEEIDQPAWPAGKFKPETLTKALENRLNRVSDTEITYDVHNVVAQLVLKLALHELGDRGASKVVEMLDGILKERDL